MTSLLDIRLPDEVMDNLPSDKQALVAYLSNHFDKVISQYELSFQRRVQGALGGPLSRYEKTMLKDFLLDAVLGKNLRKSIDDAATSPFERISDAKMAAE